MSFCTSIHCMDGRIQEPIINFLKQNLSVKYIDTITEPGPCKILAEQNSKTLLNSILARVSISVEKHGSNLIAVSGHYDCAGNPCTEDKQKTQIQESVNYLKSLYPDKKIIGFWITDEWKISPL